MYTPYDVEQEERERTDIRPLRFRPRYDAGDMEHHSELTAIDFTDDPGLTIQEAAQDADINVLMKRMGVKDGSALPYFPNPRALYGDFSEIPTDPVEIAEMIRLAQEQFMTIPAEVRQRYQTPEELFRFMNDDRNYDEAVKLGLLEKPRPKTTPPVSSSTSSDKETLVPTSNSKENA